MRFGIVPALSQSLWTAALLAMAPHAHADETGDRIARAGYDPAEWSSTSEWQERSPMGAWVSGMRVTRTSDGADMDVYFDAAGNPVPAQSLGIPEKTWDVPALNIPPQAAGTSAKSFPLPPQKWTAAYDVPVTVYAVPAPALPPPPGADDAKNAHQIGVRVALTPVSLVGHSASAGAWLALPDGGWLWSLQVESPGARGVRVHFAEGAHAAGVAVHVFGGDSTDAHRVTPSPEGTWAPTCFGERCLIECYAAAGIPLDELQLDIDEIVYVYEDPETLMKAAGFCNNDASCFPEWANQALGVGGIGTVNRTGALYCTGSLLADTNAATDTPYFLTANHCVGTQSEASTVEVYWRYQNRDCASPLDVPLLGTLQRTTGGATLLATSNLGSGTDFAFMQLRNAPPAGLTYLGFSTQSPLVGADVTAIHHPQGDFKRISFGTKIDTGSPSEAGDHGQPLDRFHEILWHDGTTEPGSSGCPVFDTFNQLLIGQLWGGRAACAASDEPDYFGRFDKTYPLVARWLGTPAPSPFDLNHSGAVDSADVQLVVNAALAREGAIAADLNLSGRTDAVDVELMLQTVLNGI